MVRFYKKLPVGFGKGNLGGIPAEWFRTPPAPAIHQYDAVRCAAEGRRRDRTSAYEKGASSNESRPLKWA
jgi:hypothetical protein